MTPAEKLASEKVRKRPPRNETPYPHKVAWKICLVRDRRKNLKLTMRDVANAVNLSVSSYCIIEKGGDPMLRSAIRIATFFGTTVEELWREPA